MLPASTKMGGQCFAMPDVCKTPSPGGPVPIPYPNIGMPMQANSGISTKTKIGGKECILQNTKIPMSSGDEAGTAGGGVVSNKFKGEVVYKKGSGKVKVEGKALCHLTSMTGHNGSNANMPAGAQIAPSQVKVLVAP
jgi:hypothetical protein